MGYCMEQTDSKFHIPSGKFADALAAVKALMLDTASMNGGSWSGGEQRESWYAFVNTESVLQAKSLTDALYAWRWRAYTSDNGDLSVIYFNGEKSGQDTTLFNAIAPYVTAGSYVAMRGEDGALWRWYFDGTNCIEQEGKVVYE